MILTIITNLSNQRFDMDIPGDVPVSKITKDLAECLAVLTKRRVNADKLAIISERLDKVLVSDNSLRDEGVWQGDYLKIMYVE